MSQRSVGVHSGVHTSWLLLRAELIHVCDRITMFDSKGIWSATTMVANQISVRKRRVRYRHTVGALSVKLRFKVE